MMSFLVVLFSCILHLTVAKRSNVLVTVHTKDIYTLFTEYEIWGFQPANTTEDSVKVEVVIDESKLKYIRTLNKNIIMGIDVIWPDADEAIRKERQRINNTARWTPDMKPDIFFQDYRDWIEYEVFLAAFLVRFPDLASIQ
eukprot:135224_1